jgi:hypothetical protein
MHDLLETRVIDRSEPGYQAAELRRRLLVLAIQILSIIIDSFFLAGCVLINWAGEKCIFSPFRLSGLRSFEVQCLEVVFAVSTFFPVLVYVTVDMISIFSRARITVAALGKTERVSADD